MDYNNGEIPLSVLVQVPGQEDDDAWLSATTCARWLALKQDVQDTYGVTIWIVPGFNAYRPLDNQKYAKQQAINQGRPQDAADPGTSSHGGVYIQWGSPRNGQASLAIDVGGYEALNRDDWYAMCRKHGFEPGFFDWEAWHIIDWDPQIGTAALAGNVTGTTATAVPTKGKKMDLFLLLTQPADGGLRRWLVDVRAETKHEISSEKFNMYKNVGMPTLSGPQPYTYGDEFRTI
ncbi:hypothetical protein ACIPY5_12040 [Microbacterium sp. NPDC089698]|uniref:hypothetical protein n=1 Tax=Microbacterium sp. NPDC089698 TaxID=3364200 RepID=UPI003801B28D